MNAATITACTKETKDLKSHTSRADIIIVAAGCPNLIREDMVKEGVVIVDAGINKIVHPTMPSQSLIVGDAAYDELYSKASLITPVPGGVGPMVVAMLLENTVKACKNQKVQ
jgi:methylenetetrahydrofolate dehydrogenase (NADP+) / methenyltetrahydrofolate cyclohydrolase